MLDLEKQKEHFINHKATFTDYGNIKILDFKNPESSAYRIRFLFEEDYCRLHISGDLGELIASNYDNMTYEKFSDFVNNTGYFEGKIDCHNRPIYLYDEEKAREDILNFLKEYEYYDDIVSDRYDFETEEEKIEKFFDEVLEYFDDEKGVSCKGFELLSEYIPDVFEDIEYFGREETGILNLYMLAFKLAKKQLESEVEE